MSATDIYDSSSIKVLKGLAYGSVNASYACSGFGVEELRELTRDDIDSRMEYFLSTNQLGEFRI